MQSSKPTGEQAAGTNLFHDLNSALANTPPDRLAGVIMITDGQVHDVPKSAQVLGFDAPVHGLLTGQPDEFDRRIEVLKAPRYGFVGSIAQHRAPGASRPAARAAPASACRSRSGAKASLTRPAAAQIGRTVTIPMAFPHSGQNIVEIELDAVPGELTAANNRVVVAADGVRENLRVLLVSGEPHAGERVWRNLLKSDAAVDLVHFTILRPPQKQDGTPINQLSLIAFPTRELFSEKIKDFDLIIFDRYQHRDILQTLYYENIARYVRGGRRAARRLRRRLCRQDEPGQHAAELGAAGDADRPADRAAVQGQAFERRPEAPRHARPAGLRGQGADLGPLVPPGRDLARPRPRGHERGRRPAAAGARSQEPRAAWPCCCPIMPGCGRAATRAADPTPTCCAGSRIG